MADFQLKEPTLEDVREACEKFDRDDGVAELAVGFAFHSHPSNRVDWEVLLKVAMLDRLYSTNVYDIRGMAARITAIGMDVDGALAAGAHEIVDRIARLSGTRIEYSFASKYCSWHRPDAYPIWDSRVERYLRQLRRKKRLEFLGKNPDFWSRYEEFVKMIGDLRDHYQLSAFSFKDIDKFLYIHGEKPSAIVRRDEAGGTMSP